MKNFSLNIKEPCHENWEAMTQLEKGKFCGSCQKTVVDFTNMSDRQIAEFFKKPAGSVCGRFYGDQLQRPIDIPKKRIPWVKYFFQFTWPAFMLFLKGCGEKESAVGEIETQAMSAPKKELPQVTMGFIMPEISPVDSSVTTTKPENKVVDNADIDATFQSLHLMGDTIAIPTQSIDTMQEKIKEAKPLDEVVVVAYRTIKRSRTTMGIVSMVRGEVTVTKESNKETPFTYVKTVLQPMAYPNPAKTGSEVAVKIPAMKEVKQLQLVSSAGSLISEVQLQEAVNEITKFRIPSNVTPGIYFLRLTIQGNETKVVKIIITN